MGGSLCCQLICQQERDHVGESYGCLLTVGEAGDPLAAHQRRPVTQRDVGQGCRSVAHRRNDAAGLVDFAAHAIDVGELGKSHIVPWPGTGPRNDLPRLNRPCTYWD